jgi:hypothetical protein
MWDLAQKKLSQHINKCNTSYWLSSVSSSLSLSSSSNVCQYSSLSLSAPALRVLDCIRIINCMLFQNMCCVLCWVTAQCYKPLLMRSNLGWPPAPHCIGIGPWTSHVKVLVSNYTLYEGKSTGSDHNLAYELYYNVACGTDNSTRSDSHPM